MPKPTCRIEVDGGDSRMMNDRLVSVTITDQTGVVNDSCAIALDDRDNAIALPSKGAEIKIWLGYEADKNIVNPYEGTKLMGTFKLDELKWAGPPDVVVLVGHAFDTEDIFKTQRTGQFHRKTVGEIINIIAERNGLKPLVHESVGAIALAHLGQRAQSDMSFVEHLANKVGAVTKVQDGNLYFAPLGKMNEISDGKIIVPEVTISRKELQRYDYTDQSRSVYRKVSGRYYDKDEGESGLVPANSEARFPSDMELSSDLPNAEEAELAAQSKNDKLKRSQKGFTFTTTNGQPELMAETIVTITDQREGVPDKWLCTHVTHTFEDNGYTTAVTAIIPDDAGDAEAGDAADDDA